MIYTDCPKCDGWTELEINGEYQDCPDCNATGHIEADPEMMVYVNVYQVERCYGGPEEGGWWFDAYQCIETFPTKNKNSDIITEELQKEHEGEAWGDISSVLGGEEIRIYTETTPKQSETTERPIYE